MTVTDAERLAAARPQASKRHLDASRWLAGGGTASALAALAASSCCVLPLILAALGAGGAAFSGLEALVALRPYILAAAALALAVGWITFLRRRKPACAADGSCVVAGKSRRTSAALVLGTLAVALATIWEPVFEPLLLKVVR